MPHQSDADPKLRPKWSPNSKRKREREREREREEALGLWRLKNEAMVISGITCYTLIRGQPGLIKGIWTAYQGRVSPEYHLSSACLQRAHRKTCGRKAVGERASQTNAYRCYHCAQMLKYNVCHSRRPLSLSLSLFLSYSLFSLSFFHSFFPSFAFVYLFSFAFYYRFLLLSCWIETIWFQFLFGKCLWFALFSFPAAHRIGAASRFAFADSTDSSVSLLRISCLKRKEKRNSKMMPEEWRMEVGEEGREEKGGRMNSVGQRSSSALWSAVIPVITADISWFWVVFRGGFYFLLIFIFFLFLFTVLAFDGTQRIPVSNFFLRVFLILSFRLISSSCLMFSTRPQASTASLRDTYFICFLTLLHPPWNYNSWPLDAHRCNLATMDVSFIWYMINCRVIRELVIHFQVDRISIYLMYSIDFLSNFSRYISSQIVFEWIISESSDSTIGPFMIATSIIPRHRIE